MWCDRPGECGRQASCPSPARCTPGTARAAVMPRRGAAASSTAIGRGTRRCLRTRTEPRVRTLLLDARVYARAHILTPSTRAHVSSRARPCVRGVRQAGLVAQPEGAAVADDAADDLHGGVEGLVDRRRRSCPTHPRLSRLAGVKETKPDACIDSKPVARTCIHADLQPCEGRDVRQKRQNAAEPRGRSQDMLGARRQRIFALQHANTCARTRIARAVDIYPPRLFLPPPTHHRSLLPHTKPCPQPNLPRRRAAPSPMG